MTNQLYTYSLIRSLYEKGEDYIDSFWPLVVKVLPANKSAMPLPDIQEGIEKKFFVNIPHHSLNIISRRATRKGYSVRENNRYSLTDKGIKYLTELESEREAERRINELVEDAKEYVNAKHHLDFTSDQTRDIIHAFLEENLEIFEQFLAPECSSAESKKTFSRDYEIALLAYFNHVESNKPAMFKTLQDLVCGSIISAVVHSKTFEETAKRFERTTVYLDSNYIFSLLGLRHEEENRPAQELFTLMKAEGSFEFRIFDFTIDEIIGFLGNYDRERHHYPAHIKVGALFSSLKARGWTAVDVREFIVSIENKLWEREIALTSTKINIKNYAPEDADRRTALRKYKPDQERGSKEQNHDLAVIDQIKAIRRKRATRIESCQAMFLTSDLKLAQFNYVEDDHKERRTISEIIPDRLLTNILWLKHPTANAKISLDSIIAMHSRQLFIDQSVWKQFFRTVTNLRKEGSIDDKDVSILLYDGNIQEVLREIDSTDADHFDSEMIIETIEEVKKRQDENKSPEVQVDLRKEILRQEELISATEQLSAANQQLHEQITTSNQKMLQLENKIDQIQRERNETVIRTISLWKKKREVEAEEETTEWLNLITLVFVILIGLFSIFEIKPVLAYWSNIEPLAWMLALILPLILALLGIKLEPLHWRSWLKQKIFNRVYKRKLKALEDFEVTLTIEQNEEADFL